MKTVFLHGLGQTAHDWDAVLSQTSLPDVDCPELSALPEGKLTYTGLRTGFEKRYTDVKEAFRICGLSLGAVLALDYAIHHKGKVDSLILIGVQYKTPALSFHAYFGLYRQTKRGQLSGEDPLRRKGQGEFESLKTA